MYSIISYGKMIADAIRTGAYVAALRRVVGPDSVVVDLGSGPGLFALLACRLGARRVYAIESDGAIQIAREAAAANGYADRLVCLQDLSTRVELPERADVIIFDLRGVLPWFTQNIPSISDARARFLKPNGTMIPQRDLLWATLVHAPDKYDKLVSVWRQDLYDLDFSAGRRRVTNAWTKARFEPEDLLVPPVQCYALDYSQAQDPDLATEINWQITRPGTAHGLAFWFDSELLEGIGFSNSPSKPELIYGHAFLPFSEPIKLEYADDVAVKLSADLVTDEYIWRWQTCVKAEDQSIKANFDQSTFLSMNFSLKQLRKKASNFVPSLNGEGQITAEVLNMMNGKTRLEKIAQNLVECFPSRYGSLEKALKEAAELSEKYSDG